jgi:acyl dehydratase
MRARFARPTYPGDTLTVSIWNVSDELAGAFRFQTENQRSEVVIDAGVFRLADAPNG